MSVIAFLPTVGYSGLPWVSATPADYHSKMSFWRRARLLGKFAISAKPHEVEHACQQCNTIASQSIIPAD